MKIVFVCTANVCRSPLAEGYLKHLLEKHNFNGMNVVSAGVAALSGAPAFECAVDVARLYGFDITPHRAQQLTPEMIESADLVLCMETWQASSVMEMAPEMMKKISLLGQYHPSSNRLFQIPDPGEFTVPETRPVFELIKAAIENYVSSAISQTR